MQNTDHHWSREYEWGDDIPTGVSSPLSREASTQGQPKPRTASPPAPLQGERGDRKLKGCDSQDRAIQIKSVKSVKSVGQEWRGS